jgi:hypothetical protein
MIKLKVAQISPSVFLITNRNFANYYDVIWLFQLLRVIHNRFTISSICMMYLRALYVFCISLLFCDAVSQLKLTL